MDDTSPWKPCWEDINETHSRLGPRLAPPIYTPKPHQPSKAGSKVKRTPNGVPGVPVCLPV